MACNLDNLHVATFCQGTTQWCYQTEDSFKAVQSKGYFNDAKHITKNGDIIHVVSSDKSSRGALLLAVERVSNERVSNERVDCSRVDEIVMAQDALKDD